MLSSTSADCTADQRQQVAVLGANSPASFFPCMLRFKCVRQCCRMLGQAAVSCVFACVSTRVRVAALIGLLFRALYSKP
jgi:hypothetical protein